MTINITMPQQTELRPRIVVFGVGGAGCNAVNNMLRADIEGVECVVANTDAQALSQSLSDRRIQLGLNITQGLGAGSRPEIGRAAAEEGLEDILEYLQGGHMVFITAGMGGGTGTGAGPVIARAAREQGILTVGVVTKPFHFEGAHRMRIAEAGIQELQDSVDTLIVIPNQNLFRVANEKTTFADAFKMADEVLHSGVRGITDLMVMPGLINLDFADIRTVMSEMGKAMMGAGEADGENRAIEAAEAAISNPLLDDVSMAGARGLLINISGGPDLTLYEVDEAANRVRDEVDPTASIIFGSTFDKEIEGRIRVSVFATGIDANSATRPTITEIPVVAPTAMLEADPLIDAVKPMPIVPSEEPLVARAPTMEVAEPITHAPSIAMSAEPSAETVNLSHGIPAPAISSDDQEGQTDMFGQPITEAPAAIAPPFAAAQPTPEATAINSGPIAADPTPKRTGLALKVVPATETVQAPTPAPTMQEAPVRTATPTLVSDQSSKKESVFGFLRGKRKETQPDPSVEIHAEAAPSVQPTAAKAQVETPPRQARSEPAMTKSAAEAENDMLEIPAFLRRQAN